MSKLVILPDSGRDLVREELALALEAMGYGVLRPHPDHLAVQNHPHYLPRLLEAHPALFLSVNLQGLQGGGQLPPGRILLEAGLPVLVWFVDNPWHILSAMRDPSWKSFKLAVSDASFIAPLRACGATEVCSLPLAAGAHMLEAGDLAAAPADLGLRAILFAGRSVFPGFEEFFRGVELPPALLEEAEQLLEAGFQPRRPDFLWWAEQLALGGEIFWPGKKARRPGLGSVRCNLSWRTRCLGAAGASPGGLTLFGDAAWGKDQSLRKVDLRPELDYYSALPAFYRAAPFSLNLNSLLLPAGLSQRCFDVWAAGGFCLTDYSAGLDIFPAELVREILFNRPEEIPERMAYFEERPGHKEDLRRAWQEEIRTRHNYALRLEAALPNL